MDKKEQIRDGLRHFAKRFGPAPTLLGTITSVDEDSLTCVIFDDDAQIDIPDIRLRPVLDGHDSITIFPKVDAYALAIRLEDTDEWMLISAGEIDKWRIAIGTAVIEQNSTGLLIQKGDDTLKKILENIIEAVTQIVVIYGNNPDYDKLSTALTSVENLFR